MTDLEFKVRYREDLYESWDERPVKYRLAIDDKLDEGFGFIIDGVRRAILENNPDIIVEIRWNFAGSTQGHYLDGNRWGAAS